MNKSIQQTREKQERVIEAVRQGLEGPEAIDFIHQSGYAMTPSGIARHLRSMGGRKEVSEKIQQGHSNWDILEAVFPDDTIERPDSGPSQAELFGDSDPTPAPVQHTADAMFETVRMTIRVPEDLHEAIKIAAKAENTRQNDLIVKLLTQALSRMPHPDALEEG